MVSGCLKSIGWKEVRQSFFAQVGLKFNTKSFNNKIQNLKSRYKEFKKLRFGQTGFGWDEEKKMVVASPKTRENYFLANPKAKKFRTMGCPEYNNLKIIFGGTTPTGRFSASLARGIESPPREKGHVSNDPPFEEVQQPSPGIADSTNIDGDQIFTTTTKQNACRKRPSKFSDAIVEQNVSTDKRFEKLVDSINGMNQKPENHFSMSNVLSELNSIE
ncbi:PREDICTED: uncharacterized protein LOC104587617 [Nelumbo nucifera]|uniref:Uncharacterized protein LOC104587617 n=2 Tax=Nelumbo nucifera TaxID=4432 RepID=A0A1U7Z7M7_NELNU|nr:PREDICTED: uncharacterized protein LOC104587617 [Nelumbo nucifera]DAD37993.1 TPA_asm: hypothetical protein HUJ06_008634 [Nelumbo nucifera]